MKLGNQSLHSFGAPGHPKVILIQHHVLSASRCPPVPFPMTTLRPGQGPTWTCGSSGREDDKRLPKPEVARVGVPGMPLPGASWGLPSPAGQAASALGRTLARQEEVMLLMGATAPDTPGLCWQHVLMGQGPSYCTPTPLSSSWNVLSTPHSPCQRADSCLLLQPSTSRGDHSPSPNRHCSQGARKAGWTPVRPSCGTRASRTPGPFSFLLSAAL